MFQNFLTELASGRGQLDDIIRMAEELVKSRHSKQREIQARQRKVSNRYQHQTKVFKTIVMCAAVIDLCS